MSNNKIHVTKENLLEFCKVINEFISDLLTPFPELVLHDGIIHIMEVIKEYKEKITDLEDNETNKELEEEYYLSMKNELVVNGAVVYLYRHCLSVFPERFFDIMYQNVEIFNNEEINTEFLPNINFAELWKQNISDNTKDIIWKYLQVILLNVVSSVKDKSKFGEAAKLFEAIDETELKNKLEETIQNMQQIFDFSNIENIQNDISNIPNVPDANFVHKHLNLMMGGKLGSLAREIAEETAEEFKTDLNDTENVGQIFQKLFKNPGNLMKIVKNVGNKLEDRLKSGDIDESELLKEATQLMSNLKNIPGMENFQHLFGQMGLPIGKNAKVNMGAFQNHMKQNLKQAETKERIMKKLKKMEQEDKSLSNSTEQNKIIEPFVAPYTDEELIKEFKFSKGDAPERSSRISNKQQNKKKNKKNKKIKKN